MLATCDVICHYGCHGKQSDTMWLCFKSENTKEAHYMYQISFQSDELY